MGKGVGEQQNKLSKDNQRQRGANIKVHSSSAIDYSYYRIGMREEMEIHK